MRLIIGAIVVTVFCSIAAHAVDVSTCGQTVPAGETGVLVADLSCGDETAVTLANKAALDLGGFTVGASDDAIVCESSCSVTGPGTIAGDLRISILSNSKRAVVNDVVIDGGGIQAPSSRVAATNILVRNFGAPGGTTPHAIVAKILVASDVIVEDGGRHGFAAVAADKILATNLTVRDTTSIGIQTFRLLRATGLTVTGNAGFGVATERTVRIDGAEISNNGGDGIAARRVKASSLTATGNGNYGVFAERNARLTDSMLTGNTDGDLFSARKPRLDNTTCGTSDGPNGPWGVCTGD